MWLETLSLQSVAVLRGGGAMAPIQNSAGNEQWQQCKSIDFL